MKMKYDESDNALIRASRALTDKVTDLLGGLFSKTEMSEVLTEILRVDPAFDKERFLQQCENDIIPNVLEVGAQPCRPFLGSHQIKSSSRDIWPRRVFSEQRRGLSSEA